MVVFHRASSSLPSLLFHDNWASSFPRYNLTLKIQGKRSRSMYPSQLITQLSDFIFVSLTFPPNTNMYPTYIKIPHNTVQITNYIAFILMENAFPIYVQVSHICASNLASIVFANDPEINCHLWITNPTFNTNLDFFSNICFFNTLSSIRCQKLSPRTTFCKVWCYLKG